MCKMVNSDACPRPTTGAGDPIHGGDKVYFDRMNGGTFSPGASLRATIGLGRIVTLYYCSSTLYKIR